MNSARSNRDMAGSAPSAGRPRTIDIDILLYGNEVAETAMLTLPHPRMSFRRFVLEPAAEIAPKMLHPTIGWPIERLLLHLNVASDQVALVSPSAEVRSRLANACSERCGAQVVEPPNICNGRTSLAVGVDNLARISPVVANSPTDCQTHRSALPYAAAAFPKLTILIDADVTQNRPTSCNGPRLSGNRAADRRCGCKRPTRPKSTRKYSRQSQPFGLI